MIVIVIVFVIVLFVIIIMACPANNKKSSAALEMEADQNRISIDKIDQILKTTLSKTLASSTNLPEVLMSTLISDILHLFEKNGNSCVLLRNSNLRISNGQTQDMIFRRIDVFDYAMKLKCIEQPLSHIAEYLTPLQHLDGDTSLEQVVECMQRMCCEEVGVVDSEQKLFLGMVTCKGILSHIRREMADQQMYSEFTGLSRFEIDEGEEDEESSLLIRSEKESRNRETTGAARFTQAQLIAQVFMQKEYQSAI